VGNVLTLLDQILDEPTNHLDHDTIKALTVALQVGYPKRAGSSLLFPNQGCMQNYLGGIVLVSHDRRLVSEVAHDLWEVREGLVASLTGTFDAYLDRIRTEEGETS
jgi:ATPase subunit of ABC transporter with duplicated ATPase domains